MKRSLCLVDPWSSHSEFFHVQWFWWSCLGCSLSCPGFTRQTQQNPDFFPRTVFSEEGGWKPVSGSWCSVFQVSVCLAKQSCTRFLAGQWGEVTSLSLWKFNSFLYPDTAYLAINEEAGTRGASLRIRKVRCFLLPLGVALPRQRSREGRWGAGFGCQNPAASCCAGRAPAGWLCFGERFQAQRYRWEKSLCRQAVWTAALVGQNSTRWHVPQKNSPSSKIHLVSSGGVLGVLKKHYVYFMCMKIWTNFCKSGFCLVKWNIQQRLRACVQGGTGLICAASLRNEAKLQVCVW